MLDRQFHKVKPAKMHAMLWINWYVLHQHHKGVPVDTALNKKGLTIEEAEEAGFCVLKQKGASGQRELVQPTFSVMFLCLINKECVLWFPEREQKSIRSVAILSIWQRYYYARMSLIYVKSSVDWIGHWIGGFVTFHSYKGTIYPRVPWSLAQTLSKT
jgi:hypothetical protein